MLFLFLAIKVKPLYKFCDPLVWNKSNIVQKKPLVSLKIAQSDLKSPKNKQISWVESNFFSLSVKQWFSTFLALRHTNFVKKFCGTPKCNKRTKMKKNDIFCILYQTLYNLVAHLEEFDGTLVRRGTPVEKHYCKGLSKLLKYYLLAE